MQTGKKCTIYMVYAHDAPKRLFRNPFFTMSQKSANRKVREMRQKGYHPKVTLFFSSAITMDFSPIKNFAKMERALA